MENNELIELYLKQLPLNVAKIINEKIKVQTNFKDCITTNDFKGLKEIFSNNEHIYLSLKEKLEIPHDLHEILQDNLNNIYYKYIVDFYLKNYQSNIAKLFINFIIKNSDIYWDVARICHFSTCLFDTSNKKLIDELCVNPKIDFRTVIIGSLYNKDKNVFLYAFKNFNKIDYFSKNLILRPLLLTPYMVENNMKFNIESWDFYFEYYKYEIFLICPELCEKDSFRKLFNKLILNNSDKDFCVYLLKKYKEYELIDNIDFFKLSTIFFLIKGIDNCFNCNDLFNEYFNRVITNYSVVDCIRNFKLIGIDEKYYNKLLLFKKLDDTLDEKFSNQEKVKI